VAMGKGQGTRDKGQGTRNKGQFYCKLQSANLHYFQYLRVAPLCECPIMSMSHGNYCTLQVGYMMPPLINPIHSNYACYILNTVWWSAGVYVCADVCAG
jgi:hypothetical protein